MPDSRECGDGFHAWVVADDATWAETWNTGHCECGRFVGSILDPQDVKPWLSAPAPRRWPVPGTS